MKKGYPNKIEKLNQALLIYIGESYLRLLKTQFPGKRKNLTKKLAYPYEFFNCIEVYQKPVDYLKKEDFFNKLRNDYPDDEEVERTKGLIKRLNTNNGEE